MQGKAVGILLVVVNLYATHSVQRGVEQERHLPDRLGDVVVVVHDNDFVSHVVLDAGQRLILLADV